METLKQRRVDSRSYSPSPELSPEARMMDEFEQALRVQGGDVWAWVELGVITGVASDTNEGRIDLARNLGLVYHCSKRDDAQTTLEELDMNKLAAMMSVNAARAQSVALHAVNIGLIRSSKEQRKQKAAARRM